jgi:hypothetical protein
MALLLSTTPPLLVKVSYGNSRNSAPLALQFLGILVNHLIRKPPPLVVDDVDIHTLRLFLEQNVLEGTAWQTYGDDKC